LAALCPLLGDRRQRRFVLKVERRPAQLAAASTELDLGKGLLEQAHIGHGVRVRIDRDPEQLLPALLSHVHARPGAVARKLDALEDRRRGDQIEFALVVAVVGEVTDDVDVGGHTETVEKLLGLLVGNAVAVPPELARCRVFHRRLVVDEEPLQPCGASAVGDVAKLAAVTESGLGVVLAEQREVGAAPERNEQLLRDRLPQGFVGVELRKEQTERAV
jgi:hypothetical protein